MAECCPKIFNTAIFDCECQKERLMCREVFMEGRQPLEEAPPPGPGASPLAEGADAPVACPHASQLGFWELSIRHLHFDAQIQSAVAYGLGHVARVLIHCKRFADR